MLVMMLIYYAIILNVSLLQGTLKDRQGLSVSGALTMAIETVNNNSNLLKDILLIPDYRDSKGDRVLSTHYITKWLCEGVKTFIGPEGSCFVESIVTQSWNLPMISHVSVYIINILQIFK